ncbi:MAG: c-type cytochrome [Verrucomicrobia bacterium]|nr:c-type cytochrome [Verrucomicrobiota bacterium]
MTIRLTSLSNAERRACLLWLVFLIFFTVTACAQPVPEWIRPAQTPAPGGGQLRRSFTAPPNLLKAILLGACRGEMRVQLNGAEVGIISSAEQAASIDLTGKISSGENLLSLSFTNRTAAPEAAVLLELVLQDGRQIYFISDGKWSGAQAGGADWQPAISLGSVAARSGQNPFDEKHAFDAYNSWKLAKGANTATTPDAITTLPGFTVELLRSALPGEDSWIALAFDPQGRITIAKEKRGLLRFTLGSNQVEKVEVINDTLLECRGLLYAYDSLYANANSSKGFFRLRDTNGDGQFDEIKELLHTEGGTGHGRNHVKLGPDGKIYLIHGDDVVLTERISINSPLRHYGDDHLIPGPWELSQPKGKLRAPLGHLLRTDKDGKNWEVVAGGLRNPLDIAFNEHGDIFTYDADSERDIAAPWYHPTRVLHLVSGADYGWRRSTGNYPPYFPDTLPSVVDIGVGSPTGIEFGTKSNFPEKYRPVLFICDWAYGRIIAVHIRYEGGLFEGAGFAAMTENFVTGRPLNVTDIAFGPDGAMYFTTGGRQTQSGLYRVRYTGIGENLTSALLTSALRGRSRIRGSSGTEHSPPFIPHTRRKLEQFHTLPNGGIQFDVLKQVWSHLGSSDRLIRHAARVALENIDVSLWQQNALEDWNLKTDSTDRRLLQPGGISFRDLETSLTALLALTRVGSKEVQPAMVKRLNDFFWPSLTEEQQLTLLRVYELAFIRFGRPDAALLASARARLEPLFPSPNHFANHELVELLVYLDSPLVLPRTMELLRRAESSEDLMRYLLIIRLVKSGWTLEQRRVFLDALVRAEQKPGARDYVRVLQNLRAEWLASLTAAEKGALGLTAPAKVKPLLGAVMPRTQFIRDWKLEDFGKSLDTAPRGRSFERGRTMFTAATCAACHRVGSEGGVIGPDLTAVASRFGRRDLLDQILNPSKVMDDKFRNAVLTLKDGRRLTGSVELEDDRRILLRTEPLSDDTTEVLKTDLRQRELSEVSPMPAGLLNGFQRDEILDLLAFIEAGGDAKHANFKVGN